MNSEPGAEGSPIYKRRPRYAGKHPRRFEEKYKEFNPEKYPDAVAKVVGAGKTPAGSHRPIMVEEVMAALQPRPGEVVVDCTLGYGGHAREFLERIQPNGKLIGLDADPAELPRTVQRLRDAGYSEASFSAHRSNFAGLAKALAIENATDEDIIFGDLGVSSMQIDNPARGFSYKTDGPLDMRMNPERGQPASAFLKAVSPTALEKILQENADETRAAQISVALAGAEIETTRALANRIWGLLANARRMSVNSPCAASFKRCELRSMMSSAPWTCSCGFFHNRWLLEEVAASSPSTPAKTAGSKKRSRQD